MHMNSQPISFPQYIDNPNQIGPFEVDDLITNTFGGVLAHLLYQLVRRVTT